MVSDGAGWSAGVITETGDTAAADQSSCNHMPPVSSMIYQSINIDIRVINTVKVFTYKFLTMFSKNLFSTSISHYKFNKLLLCIS